MTPEGRYVAFAENPGTPAQCDLAVGRPDPDRRDRQREPSRSRQRNGLCDSPQITPDGRYVSFLSEATDLVTKTVSGGFQAYVRDMESGATVLASADLQGSVLAVWIWPRHIGRRATHRVRQRERFPGLQRLNHATMSWPAKSISSHDLVSAASPVLPR